MQYTGELSISIICPHFGCIFYTTLLSFLILQGERSECEQSCARAQVHARPGKFFFLALVSFVMINIYINIAISHSSFPILSNIIHHQNHPKQNFHDTWQFVHKFMLARVSVGIVNIITIICSFLAIVHVMFINESEMEHGLLMPNTKSLFL